MEMEKYKEEALQQYFILENVRPVLMNRKRLVDLPERCPFIEMEDLVILFHIEIPPVFISGVDRIEVTEKQREKWGLSIQELYELALKNLKEMSGVKIYTLESIGESVMTGLDKREFDHYEYVRMQEPELVITNEDMYYGAAAILDTESLQMVSEIVKEDLYIIPLNVHFCILLPKSCKEPEELTEILKKTMMDDVPLEERLVNHLYEYRSDLKKIVSVEGKKRERKDLDMERRGKDFR